MRYTLVHGSQLSTHNIKKLYQQGTIVLNVLNGITYTFSQNSTYALTGVSGTGKSTLLHLLAGLDEPTSGEVYFDNKNISQMIDTERQQFLNKSVGLLFQLPYLIKELSVIENIMIPGLIVGLSKHTCMERAQFLLASVDLLAYSAAVPTTLSGGQQQRVALARALFNKPRFLLADEPTGNLDKQTGLGIVELILACAKQWHMGVIISSHDSYVTQAMDEVLTIHAGHLICTKQKEERQHVSIK